MNGKKSSIKVDFKPAYRWIMLILSWLIYFSFGLIYTTLSVVVTSVMTDLDLSYAQMGFILGSWQLIYIFVAQPIGLLIDCIGPYKSLLLGSTIISISAALRGFAFSFETLTVFTALFGVGGSLISIGLPKLASIWFIGKERGTASGVYTTGPSIGSIVALSCTNSVIIPLVGNWKNAFLAYSFIGLMIAVLWLVGGSRPPSPKKSDASRALIKEDAVPSVKGVFRSQNVWLVVIIGITSFLTSHGLSNWLPKILELKGLTPYEAGLTTSVLNVFGIFGSILIPRLPYLLGSKKVTISLLLFSQGIAILILGLSEGFTLWLATALYGVSRGLVPLLMVTLMDMPEVGSGRMGVVGGLFFAIGEIGGFGGPFLMGLLKDFTGTFLSGIFFLAVVCESAIALAFLLKVDQSPKNRSY